MGRSWSRFESAGDLARNHLSLVHLPAVVRELILASEAVAFSMVLASDHRALEFGGVVAVCGGGVAVEVRPTLCAEAAIFNRTVEGGYINPPILLVMVLLMHNHILNAVFANGVFAVVFVVVVTAGVVAV